MPRGKTPGAYVFSARVRARPRRDTEKRCLQNEWLTGHCLIHDRGIFPPQLVVLNGAALCNGYRQGDVAGLGDPGVATVFFQMGLNRSAIEFVISIRLVNITPRFFIDNSLKNRGEPSVILQNCQRTLSLRSKGPKSPVRQSVRKL